MRITVFIFVACLFISSCKNHSKTAEEFIASLPQVTPQKIVEFNGLDSLYFRHLSYKTIPLENGNFILADRTATKAMLVDKTGELVKLMARKGRGPGELLDVNSMARLPESGILIYDQNNNKAVVFNSDKEYRTEFLIEPYREAMITGVFPSGKADHYIIGLQTSKWLFDKNADNELLLANYNAEVGNFTNLKRYKFKKYARRLADENIVGAVMVPYYPSQLFRYNPHTQTYFMFWTNSNKIAEVNAHFDTLRTIPVNLPFQPLNDAESDSINEAYGDSEYPEMDEFVPELKTPVKEMLVDNKGRIWLQLNYRGETQKWVILNREGEPQKIVHLPKDVMLTHVSPHHLGVRLNENTFALFEAVE